MDKKKKLWSLESNNTLEKIADMIFRVLSIIAILAVVVIMVITVLDVILRTVANVSVKGVMEYTEFLMVPVCYCAMPWVTWQFGHIKVDILTSHLPKKVEKWFLIVDKAIIAVFSAFMSYQVWQQGKMAIKMHSVGGITKIPIYPFYYLTSIMMGVVVIAMIVNLLSLIALGKEKDR